MSMFKRKLSHFVRMLTVITLIAAGIMSVNASSYDFAGGWLANAYVPLAYIGQAFLMSLLLGIALVLFTVLPVVWFNRLFGVIAGTYIFVLCIDAWVFSIYRFHINPFFIKMFFTDIAGIGIGPVTLIGSAVGFIIVIAAVIGLTAWLWRLNFIKRPLLTYFLLFVATLAGQSLHAWGYAHNMRAIVSLTHTIPWYVPLTATSDIKKFGLLNEELIEENLAIDVGKVSGFNYPKNALQCSAEATPNIVVISLESWRFDQLSEAVTPNLWQIGSESLIFNNHLSTGTVTDRGLFGLMYGVSPVYFRSAMGAGLETTITRATKQLGYEHWILANQDIEVNKLDTLLFKGLEPLQSLPYGKVYEGDSRLVTQFKKQLEQRSEKTPFFSFMLFNSSHFPYWTPPGFDSPFVPHKQFSISKATGDTDPTPYFNQYSNSLNFLDGLVGEVKSSLIERGEWDNTILVVTGDHGEEFKDQSEVYWGHGSNFNRYQTGVSLVMHWPGKQEQISHRTSHEDVMPTIVKEGLLCDTRYEDITTGKSLFDASQRVNIVESYVNQAIILDDSVNEILPGLVLSYEIDDITEPSKTSAEALVGIKATYERFR